MLTDDPEATDDGNDDDPSDNTSRTDTAGPNTVVVKNGDASVRNW